MKYGASTSLLIIASELGSWRGASCIYLFINTTGTNYHSGVLNNNNIV